MYLTVVLECIYEDRYRAEQDEPAASAARKFDFVRLPTVCIPCINQP